MNGKLQAAAGSIAAAIALAAGGAGTATAAVVRGEFKLGIGTREPGTGTSLQLDILFRHPDDPERKPPALTAARFDLPAGTRFDTSAAPVCRASDEQFRAQGPGACPEGSRVGSGSFTAITGFGPPADPFVGDIVMINGGTELVELVLFRGTQQVAGLDRISIEGSSLVPHPPSTPGGPPDGRTVPREIHITLDRRGSFVTTPATCPAGGWSYGARFQFADGGSDTDLRTAPCDRKATAAAQPAMSLAVSPRRVRRGRHHTMRFAVGSADATCARGALVRFAGRRVRTDNRGRARMRVPFVKVKRHNVRVSKPGCRSARSTVTATG